MSLCLSERFALLSFTIIPSCESHQFCREFQALQDPFFRIVYAFQRIAQKVQPGLGIPAQRQSFSHLHEPIGEILELTASVHFPTGNHFLDFSEIVGGGSMTRNDAGNRLTHPIAGQRRSFAHVTRHLLGISTAGIDSRHVELRGRSLVLVADLTKVIEGLFRIDTAFLDEFLAQQAALLFSGIDAWVKEVEEFKQERQALARAAR